SAGGDGRRHRARGRQAHRIGRGERRVEPARFPRRAGALRSLPQLFCGVRHRAGVLPLQSRADREPRAALERKEPNARRTRSIGRILNWENDMTDKVIVTNLGALKAKYPAGVQRIRDAVGRLIAADKKRGLATALVSIDSASDMQAAKGAAVTAASDPRQAKAAIDAVWTAYTPDYLLILGAPDVVPMQVLANPARGDGDASVPSDLPYACSASWGQDTSAFLGPTRVVG